MKKLFYAICVVAALVALSSCGAATKAVSVVDEFVSYDITFDVGKATLKSDSNDEIARIAALMIDNPDISYEVQGHTDNTGSAAANKSLSLKRAQAVVNKLISLGIPAERLTAVGKGQEEPIADNSTEEGRAKNRRVVFVKK